MAVISDGYPSTLPADFSGERVKAYIDLLLFCNELEIQQRILSRPNVQFGFLPEDAVAAIAELGIRDALALNRTHDHEQRTFYSRACSFQDDVTRTWRGTPPRVSMLVPPVSVEDKTTNKGSGKVIIGLLVLFGILKATASDALEGKISSLSLGDDWDRRWLILTGDGLTQIRVRSFQELYRGSSNTNGGTQGTSTSNSSNQQTD